MPSTAAPPTAIPPIAPLLSGGEEAFEALVAEGDAVALVVAELVVDDEDIEVADEDAAVAELLGKPVFESPLLPSAVKLTYAAQSGLGSARGQLGSWQREKS